MWHARKGGIVAKAGAAAGATDLASTAATGSAAPTAAPTASARDVAGKVTFDKRGCQALLRKHPALEGRVAATVESQLAHGLFKSKFATAERWEGQPVWECRVNEASIGSVRAAFSVRDGEATVIYLSPTLQKRAFTAELDRFLRRRP